MKCFAVFHLPRPAATRFKQCLLAGALGFGLAACGGGDPAGDEETGDSSADASPAGDDQKAADKPVRRITAAERREQVKREREEREQAQRDEVRDRLRKTASEVLATDRPKPVDARTAFWVWKRFPEEHGDEVLSQEELPMSKLIELLEIAREYKRISAPVEVVHIDQLPWDEKNRREAEKFVISRITDENLDDVIAGRKICLAFPKAILKHDATRFVRAFDELGEKAHFQNVAVNGYKEGLLKSEHIAMMLQSKQPIVLQTAFDCLRDSDEVPADLIAPLESMRAAIGDDKKLKQSTQGSYNALRKAYVSKYRDLLAKESADANTRAYYTAMMKTLSAPNPTPVSGRESPLSKFVDSLDKADPAWPAPLAELDLLAVSPYAEWILRAYTTLGGAEGVNRCTDYALRDTTRPSLRGQALFEVFKADRRAGWQLLGEFDKRKITNQDGIVRSFGTAWHKDPDAVSQADVEKLATIGGEYGYHLKEMLKRR